MFWFCLIMGAAHLDVPAPPPVAVAPAELRIEDVMHLFRSTYRWKRNIDVQFPNGQMFDTAGVGPAINPDPEWFNRSMRTLIELLDLANGRKIKNYLMARLYIVLQNEGQYDCVPINLGCFASEWASKNQKYNSFIEARGYEVFNVAKCLGPDLNFVGYRGNWMGQFWRMQIPQMVPILREYFGHMKLEDGKNKFSESEHGLFAYLMGDDILQKVCDSVGKTTGEFVGCILDVASLNDTCGYCDIFYNLMFASGNLQRLMQDMQARLVHLIQAPANKFLIRVISPRENRPYPSPRFLGTALDIDSRLTLNLTDRAEDLSVHFFDPNIVMIKTLR